jgi:hypothetical protein
MINRIQICVDALTLENAALIETALLDIGTPAHMISVGVSEHPVDRTPATATAPSPPNAVDKQPRKPRGRTSPEIDRQILIDLDTTNLTQVEVGARYGLSGSYVSRLAIARDKEARKQEDRRQVELLMDTGKNGVGPRI